MDLAAALSLCAIATALVWLVQHARAKAAEARAAEASWRVHEERQHEADTEVSAGDSLPDRIVLDRLRDAGF